MLPLSVGTAYQWTQFVDERSASLAKLKCCLKWRQRKTRRLQSLVHEPCQRSPCPKSSLPWTAEPRLHATERTRRVSVKQIMLHEQTVSTEYKLVRICTVRSGVVCIQSVSALGDAWSNHWNTTFLNACSLSAWVYRLSIQDPPSYEHRVAPYQPTSFLYFRYTILSFCFLGFRALLAGHFSLFAFRLWLQQHQDQHQLQLIYTPITVRSGGCLASASGRYLIVLQYQRPH